MNKKLILHVIVFTLMASPLMGLPNNRYTKFTNEPENIVKEEKKSNLKYIWGVISAGVVAGLGYLGYQYYKNKTFKYIRDESLLDEPKVHLSDLPTQSEPKAVNIPVKEISQNNNNHINQGLEIAYGENKAPVKPYSVDTLDKKLQLLSKATSDFQETMSILKEIIEENNLPSDHDILRFAEDICYKRPKNSSDQIDITSSLQTFSHEDQTDILDCLKLLLQSMKNRESAFQYICNDSKKRTQNKVHKKFERRRVNTDFFSQE